MAVTKGERHRREQAEFHPALPHLDEGLFARVAAEERRLGVKRFDVAADGDGFGERRAIVEKERRNFLQRIDRRIGLLLVLMRHEVDVANGNRDVFLSQENANPPGIWRQRRIVEQHVGLGSGFDMGGFAAIGEGGFENFPYVHARQRRFAV